MSDVLEKPAFSPSEAGLPAELENAAPRRWTNRATPVLFGLVLLAGGFLGGVAVQRQWGETTTATTAPVQVPRQGGMPSGGFPQGGGPGGRDATTGTLKSVTAGSIILETADGKTLTVRIAESAKVQRTTTLGELRTGQSVTVQGSTATDGTITATEVTGS